MSTANTLRKLANYKKYPDMVKEVSPSELADLVVLVLDQVKVIEKSINDKKLDIDTKFTKDVERFAAEQKQSLKTLTDAINTQLQNKVEKAASELNQTADAFEKRVQEALANIRNGEDGIVTEEEIEKAAQMAFALLELPDFEAMVSEAINSDGEAVRNALELLKGEDRYQVFIEDVKGLEDRLSQIAQMKSQGGGVGTSKPAVVRFVNEAVASGEISLSGGGISDGDKGDVTVASSGAAWTVTGIQNEPVVDANSSDGDILVYRSASNAWVREAKPAGGSNPALNDVTDVTISTVADNEVLAYDNGTSKWINQTAAEAGLATAAQGALADSAIQPGDNISTLTNDSGFITDYTVTEADVTTHEAALSITESQISDLKNYQIKAVANGSLTAALDTYYICVSNSTFTDPSPTEGEGFAVFVRNGTATVGGTGYSTAGTIVHRIFHSGAWANYVYNVSSTFATAAQGALADSALQSSDIGVTVQAYDVDTAKYDAVIANFTGTLQRNGATVLTAIEDDANPTLGGNLGLLSFFIDIANNLGFRDDDSNEFILFQKVASAVNYLLFKNASTGTNPSFTAAGSDTNIGINLIPKGSGEVQVNGQKIIDESDIDADLLTLSLPANTTISTFGASLVDDADAATARTTLGAYGSGDNPTFGIISYDQADATVDAVGNSGASQSVDADTATVFTYTLNSNTTFTFSNFTSGRTIEIHLYGDGTGGYTPTFPTAKPLYNGATLTYPTATTELLVLSCRHNGTDIIISAAGNYEAFA